MSANQLYLLADHIKLSLLERHRTQTLNLPNVSQQDAQISQSLQQFKSGLDSLESENKRLLDAGDAENAGAASETLAALRKQLDDLTSQFHGFSSPSIQEASTHAHQPALQAASWSQQPKKTSLRTPSVNSNGPAFGGEAPSKTVRFRDNPDPSSAAAEAELFGRYRDDPSPGQGYANTVEAEGMDNAQIHAYNHQIMREQDDQLDALGVTIGRQRELSMRIGDELDNHVQLLDDMDTITDRHSSRLARAKRGIGKVIRGVGESKQMMIIIALIVILVLLIAITK